MSFLADVNHRRKVHLSFRSSPMKHTATSFIPLVYNLSMHIPKGKCPSHRIHPFS